MIRKPYPSDVSDDEWAFVAPYLALLPETSGQREYALREVFNGLRYVVRNGIPWRAMPPCCQIRTLRTTSEQIVFPAFQKGLQRARLQLGVCTLGIV